MGPELGREAWQEHYDQNMLYESLQELIQKILYVLIHWQISFNLGHYVHLTLQNHYQNT